MPYPKRLTKKNIELSLQQIAEGKSLRSICDRDPAMPSWRSFLKHVRENDDVHSAYRRARIDQAETLRDYLLELTQRDLPTDKQFANAEVQRRKLEADVINKMIGSAQNRGLRDRVEARLEGKKASSIHPTNQPPIHRLIIIHRVIVSPILRRLQRIRHNRIQQALRQHERVQ